MVLSGSAGMRFVDGVRVLYAVLMAAVIVTMDVVFFKHRFWERLTADVGVVLVFAAFYFRFLKRP